MDSSELSNFVVQRLRDDLGDTVVGDADLPEHASPTALPFPHCIVTPMPSSQGHGSMADPEEDRDYLYQVLCVGRSRKQAEWMGNKVFESLIYGVIELPSEAGNVQGVAVDSFGSIVRTEAKLFQRADSYRVKAGK